MNIYIFYQNSRRAIQEVVSGGGVMVADSFGGRSQYAKLTQGGGVTPPSRVSLACDRPLTLVG